MSKKFWVQKKSRSKNFLGQNKCVVQKNNGYYYSILSLYHIGLVQINFPYPLDLLLPYLMEVPHFSLSSLQYTFGNYTNQLQVTHKVLRLLNNEDKFGTETDIQGQILSCSATKICRKEF